jgi:formylglycine-generating enzyme required for sulfatase activity
VGCAIERALAGAGLVVVLISRAGSEHDGWYAREEIARAIDDTRLDGKRIIPVKLDPDLDERMPYGLRRLVAIDAHDRDWVRVADGIAAAIERRPVAYRPPARGWRAWLGRLLRFLGVGPATEPPPPPPRGALPPSATTPIAPTSPTAPPAAAPPPLALLRDQLRALHGTLVPFFQRADDPTTLDDIYVELALDRTLRELPDAAAPRELTLEALMRGTHRRHGRWAILGEPGAGKSTLARHLVWQQAAPDTEPLTLYIGLADWAEFAGDPFDFLEAELHQHHGLRAAGLADVLRALAAEDPGDGPDRLWLIFDGFDEIAPAYVRTTRDRIITFAAAHPHLTLAVTSRPIGYENIAGFTPARVQKLDPARRRALLIRWLGATDGDAAFNRIEAQTALVDREGPLAGNPLLLSLLARLAADRPDRALPATRAALLGDAIELLLTRGHSRARRGLGDRAAGARRLLAALALDLTAIGGEAWTRRDARRPPRRLLRRPPAQEAETRLAQRRRLPRPTPATTPASSARTTAPTAAGDSCTARCASASPPRRWREEGAKRIAARIRAIADDPAQLGRWGETLGMACALLDDPTAPLRALQAADAALTLRVLPELTGLPPVVVLDVLWGIDPNQEEGWNGDTLLALARRWPVDEAVARLTERVTPALDLDRLAFIHYALTGLDRRPERAAFFARAGRPVERVPPLAMVTVPAGTFRMGSPEGEDGRFDGEGPQHRVILTAPYLMGATPVTRAEYAAFDPAHDCPGDAEHPVTEVSWWRAALYAAWADAMLPTEAQWEYACRAGTTTRFWSGDADADLARVGWYDGNSGDAAHRVAEKPANPWGLYDMHGNVFEWCADWHGTYPAETVTDPPGPPSGDDRVVRGGAFDGAARGARSAGRNGGRPGSRDHGVGFRLVRALEHRP